MENIAERYARRDSITGLGMNEGWCFGEGDFYCADEENALIYAKELGYESIQEAYEDEAGYWTTWEEIDEDCYYDEFGNEYATN